MSKIIGNTTATPTPRSDWNQIDPTKADFILNKPELGNLTTKAYVDGQITEVAASAQEYADNVKNDLLNGAGAAYDTLKELGDLIDENVDAIEALETVAANHSSNKNNPHGVTLSQLGVTATAAELNYVDGVTSNIQVQLDDKAPAYTAGTDDLVAGSSTLAAGRLYFVWKKKE